MAMEAIKFNDEFDKRLKKRDFMKGGKDVLLVLKKRGRLVVPRWLISDGAGELDSGLLLYYLQISEKLISEKRN